MRPQATAHPRLGEAPWERKGGDGLGGGLHLPPAEGPRGPWSHGGVTAGSGWQGAASSIRPGRGSAKACEASGVHGNVPISFKIRGKLEVEEMF